MPPSSKQIQKQLTSPENRIATCREYTRLWQEYFRYFADGFPEDRVITDEEERNFFMMMNVLAQNHYRFCELSAPFFKDGDGLLRILSETPSLNSLKTMSEAQFSKLLIDWHTLFIAMNKAIGKLNAQLPPAPAAKNKKAA